MARYHTHRNMFPSDIRHFNPFTENGMMLNYLSTTNQYQQAYNFELQRSLWAQEYKRREETALNNLSFYYSHKIYPEVIRILETESFSKENHVNLQKLWYNAHYEEVKAKGKDSLSPVSRYRIRKKFPLPTTIWDGEEINYCFKEKSRQLLHEIYKQTNYPSSVQKDQLSKETGLSPNQISNWFKNRRQRQRHLDNSTTSESVAVSEEKCVTQPTQQSDDLEDVKPTPKWESSFNPFEVQQKNVSENSGSSNCHSQNYLRQIMYPERGAMEIGNYQLPNLPNIYQNYYHFNNEYL